MKIKETAEKIYEEVKKKILSGELKENTKISERFLCELYETSRTTVRSAIKKLKNDGWLYVQVKSGTYVSPVDLKVIKDNFEVRLILEPSMINMAMTRITKKDIERMKTNCKSMENCIGMEQYVLAEADNHNVIKEKCNNNTIIKIIDDMMSNIHRITYKIGITEQRRKDSVVEWKKIIRNIELKDNYMAKLYLTQHIINSSEAYWNNFD